ncbi:MAG: 2-C-methyl-D-erythritol 2,4-cyclodiphosphate synthase [Solirubrobacteraceae bacterium]
MSVATGFGYDVHRFVEGRPLVLGGVEIPHSHGLLGHSDADVLTHAIIDALLGAAGLGDIGEHFPDTDERYRGADSTALLSAAAKLVRAEGWVIEQIDATVVIEAPKLSPFKPSMRERLAQVLDVPPLSCNVKATRGEGMGFIGRLEGAAAMAVATLSRQA